jgi:zinc transport system ATP-binding protein
MTHPLVTIRDLRVTLGGTAILNGVNADLAKGKITAVMGLNGSGKTTLLRAILKEIPFTGKIQFHCGHDHRQPSPQHVGYVPQKLRIDANLPLTVRDLLALALQRRPLFLGVGRKTERTLHEMLALVSALLLLDEPAAGVDFKDQEKFYDLIARINHDKAVTMLLVSHDVGTVSRKAHHVVCLKDGAVHCQGTPQEIVTNEMLMLRDTFGAEMSVYSHAGHTHS